MKRFSVCVSVKLIVMTLVMAAGLCSQASDWPMWRCDSARTAVSSGSLPDAEPSLIWRHQFTPRTQVWDSPLNNYLMQYDKVFEPIVSGRTLMLGFNDSDKMVAMDTRTGKIKWTFFTDGPIRLAPAASNGKVYFGSDDGVLYCLDIETGTEVWTFKAAPAGKKLIGNRRVISMWPVRGGVVVEDGKVYFSAGIWPFMGVFIYALDAETGKVLWLNDHDSIKYRAQPHKPSMAFSGVAPQGAFAINADRLIAPGGRSIPAILDLKNGDILRYDFAKHSKYVGGDFIASIGNAYYTRGRNAELGTGSTQFDIKSGNKLLRKIVIGTPVLEADTAYFSGDKTAAYRSDEQGKLSSTTPLWSVDVNSSGDLIKAGDKLYAAGDGKLSAIDVESGTGVLSWQVAVNGDVVRLIAADDKLFAVTSDGHISAFGTSGGLPTVYPNDPKKLTPSQKSSALADKVLAATNSRSGWALVNGSENLSLVNALLQKSSHNFVVLDSSVEKVAKARALLDAAGVYGTRVTVHVGTPSSFDLAPYAVELAIVSDKRPLSSADCSQLLNNLRPYGGTLFALGGNTALEQLARAGDMTVETQPPGTVITRAGALEGAASWTHNYGSIAQTAKSDDTRVKLPLGMLWWGGSSNMDVLPRHAHGPSEQVIGGRLYIQGVDVFTARDVYTGRVIWQRDLNGLNKSGVYFGKTYNPDPLAVGYNQIHIPGANIRGTNYVATEDKLYLLFDEKCLVLDSATGKTLKTLYLPGKEKWGYIGVQGDLLIGGAGFSIFVDEKLAAAEAAQEAKKGMTEWAKKTKVGLEIFNKGASQQLVVMNRHNGSVIWKKTAVNGFLHNGIVVGNNKLFAIDRVPALIIEKMRRRGQSVPEAELKAFNLKTGDMLWSKAKDVFGSYISFSSKHNILLHSTRPSWDMTGGEAGNRMMALNADSGAVLWNEFIKYRTFPILHTDEILSESGKWSLLTGKPVGRINPITKTEEKWSWERTYGCNYPVASEHMLTFRSGAASFYDLEGDGGTGSFGGFKSGCSINLIAADGVLSAPDYTRTCNCSYQNQTSLALIHMPDLEFWTTSTLAKPEGKELKRIGVNFGAPGDRKSGETFWVDYPSIGGKSPDPSVHVNGGVKWNLNNAARFGKDDKNWVYASNAEGMSSFNISLEKAAEQEVRPRSDEGVDIIAKGAEWSYLAGKAPAANWTSGAADTSKWKKGPAGFGYSDGDDATELNSMRNNYASVCIRKEFVVRNPSDISALNLRMGYDDYFTAYLNGKKVVDIKKSSHERKKGTWETFEIADPSTVLVKGKNVIAIEGFNINPGSSDFSLDPYLTAQIKGDLVAPASQKKSDPIETRLYTVRLFFAEHESIKAGDRVFDLSLNGTKVLTAFDIASESGGPRKGIVKEFKHVKCSGDLLLEMKSASKPYGSLISGIEIIQE